MSDIALENARARREALLARRDELKKELTDVDANLAVAEDFIHHWMVFANVDSGENQNNPATGTLTPLPVTSPIRGHKIGSKANSKKDEVAAEVRKIIEEQAAPVLRKDLLPVLRERGYRVEGGDPDMVLSTMLWRAGDAAGVVRLKKGGYWLKEKDWPEAGYFANPERALAELFERDSRQFGDLVGERLKAIASRNKS